MRIFLRDPSNIYRKEMEEILNSYNVVYNRALAPRLNALFVRSWEKNIKDKLVDEISSQMNRYKIKVGNQNPYDHGILGAVNMISHLESRSIPIDSVLHEALTAIAFHNDGKISNISIEEHPIAFLLILCDQLQDWDRVIIKHDERLTEFDNILLNLSKSDEGKLQFPGRLKVRFEYKDEKTLRKTGWSYDLFLKSKREHIGRLKFPTDFNPKGIDIEVLVLHQLS
jgi:hypothetical protein